MSRLALPATGVLLLCSFHGSAPPADPCQGPAEAAHCGTCHKAVHDEWRGSAHGRAFTDPVYQRALKGRERPELCHNCHTPARVLDRLGKMPKVRTDHVEEGITCVSCHRRGEAIHGPFGAETTAHASVQDAAFQGSSALCSSCHGTRIADVLPVAKDFEAAKLEQQGLSCTGCHMPQLERALAVEPGTDKPSGPVRRGRSHALLGPGDPAFCAKAFAFAVKVHQGRVRVQIGNEAGHRIPGLIGLRSFPMKLRLLDEKGACLHEQPFTISSDNPLQVQEVRFVDLPQPKGTVSLQVLVDHVFDGRTVARVVEQTLEVR